MSKLKKNHLFMMAVLIAVSGSTYADHTSETVQPDNSAVNQRDHMDSAKTADHQGSAHATRSDVELTRMIRRDLTKMDSLSTYGKNVKIITENGMVTLRGPVRSAEEQARIESAAKKIAGNTKVRNELEIKQ